MSSNNLKKIVGSNAKKGIILLSSLALISTGACTVNISSNDPSGKDNNQGQAVVSNTNSDDDNNQTNTNNGSDDNGDEENGKENENGNTDENNNGNEDDNNQTTSIQFSDVDSCGFTVTDPGSFADRVQGLYKIVTDDEEVDEYIEFYNVADNLYAYYSGYGYGGMEFFANDYEGFASKTADSMEVKIVSFSDQSQYGTYFSKGMPAIMNMAITDEGIEFSNYMQGSGDLLFKKNAKLERVDSEIGHLGSFAYADEQFDVKEYMKDMNIEIGETPEELIGSWILLGDIETGIILEFTEEGYVQVYLKNMNNKVYFGRGTYAVGEKKINKGNNVYLCLATLGNCGEPSFQNFCYVIEGNGLSMVAGDEDFGPDFAWEHAMFVPFDMNSIPRQIHDEEALANNFSSYYGTYYAEDGHMLILSEEGYFYLYDSRNANEMTEFYEGTFEETPGSLELYQTDYKDGGLIQLGFITLVEPDYISLSFYDNNKAIYFTRY